MKYKTRKIKRFIVYTSIILHLSFLVFVEMKYASSILLSLKRKTMIQEFYFNYTSEVKHFLRLKTNT